MCRLHELFMVLATQNPLEQSGTYPLPDAQLDRFLFKIVLDYPSLCEEIEITRRVRPRAVQARLPLMWRIPPPFAYVLLAIASGCSRCARHSQTAARFRWPCLAQRLGSSTA